MRSLTIVGLLLTSAGCALRSPPPPAPWVAGTYEYRSDLEGVGEVAGRVVVAEEGPLEVTSNRGACRASPNENFRSWERSRTFGCGGFSLTVTLESGGQRGTVSNERTVERRRTVRGDCVKSVPSSSGAETCLEWAEEVITERQTTGSTKRFWLLQASVAAQP